jgi:hypothetical protein
MDITSRSIVQANKDIVTAEVLGKVVMMDVNSGKYFSLAGPGGNIWEIIQQPVAVDAIVDELLQRYDVPRDLCERDVLEILRSLLEKGLVRKI